MAGAMAGSAILSAPQRSERLSTVTLTVNNICNLACPHCYLQYDGANCIISDNLIDHIFSASFDQICLVGKEPLANQESVLTVKRIVTKAQKNNIAVSLITNGLNGELLDSEILSYLNWVDVSLDGGRNSYQRYRNGSWKKLERSVKYMRSHGLKELRIMNTLSSETIGSVVDMVDSAWELGAEKIVFSPYQKTAAAGIQSAHSLSPDVIIKSLDNYHKDERIFLAFDAAYLKQQPHVESAIQSARQMFGDRLHLVSTDPIDRGIIRITYDGLILTPFESIDTAHYSKNRRDALAQTVDDWFACMLGESKGHSKYAHHH